MAVLGTTDRRKIFAHFQRENLGAITFSKTDLSAAVAAADDWVDANSAAYNSTLPVAFRTTATPTQKAALLAFVVMRRAGLLRVEGD